MFKTGWRIFTLDPYCNADTLFMNFPSCKYFPKTIIIDNCQLYQLFQHRGQKQIRHKIASLQGSLTEDSAKVHFCMWGKWLCCCQWCTLKALKEKRTFTNLTPNSYLMVIMVSHYFNDYFNYLILMSPVWLHWTSFEVYWTVHFFWLFSTGYVFLGKSAII